MPYTDDQGRVRPITPRKLGVGGLVVALGLGVTVAFGAAGGLGGGTAAAPQVGVDASVSVRQARTSREKADRTRVRLSTRGANATGRAQDDGDRCAELAYGGVRQFFLEHPCRSLQRGTFSVSPQGRDRVVVAVAWIEMPDAEEATALRRVLDTPGTGSVRPQDPRVELTGEQYASTQDGPVVTVAEAEPDGRSVPGRVLQEVAERAAG